LGLWWDADLTIHDHRTGGVETVPLPDGAGGHGGGDAGMMRAFARASLESHLLAFAAERSRMTGATVDMAAYRAEVENSVPARV
jgi:hypothetical protein